MPDNIGGKLNGIGQYEVTTFLNVSTGKYVAHITVAHDVFYASGSTPREAIDAAFDNIGRKD